MKIGFISLGCPKNQVDTEVMLHLLLTAGYEICAEETEADIVIINTCAFIEAAKRESIDNILDIAWLKENHTLRGIIVCGCMAERYRDEIFAEMPEVDAVLGVGSLHDIVAAVENVAARAGDIKTGTSPKFTSFRDAQTMPLGGDRVLTTPDYTAYLKIAEGCDNRCSYCAIPGIRGGFRSRTVEDIVAEARGLQELGVAELCIIAQDTTRYGLDLYGERRLSHLLRSICAATEIPWIRLLYCYPDEIDDELIHEIHTNPRILKYIDLPLQHISRSVLARMGRRGDPAKIREITAKLRAHPEMVIRTTFIVGFPGESEGDFEELCLYIKEEKFERAGVFAYSREEGTPAYEFSGQLGEQEKQDRCDRLSAILARIYEEKQLTQVGRVIDVLCEGYDTVAEIYYGRSRADAPEIDGRVYFTSPQKIKPGSFQKVAVTELIDGNLVGTVSEDGEVPSGCCE